MRLARLICISLATLALAACSRHKAAPDVDVDGEYMLMAEYYAQLTDSAGVGLDTAWHDAYLPFKLDIYAPAQASISGRATMVRDSAIYLSVRVMGVEGAVALIRRDSVFVHDKYHKIYIADSAGALLSDIGLGRAQAALTGQPFAPGPLLDSICWVLPTSAPGLIESLSIDLPDGAQSYCAYSQWVDTDCGRLSGQCDLLVFDSPYSDTPSAQASVEWNWKSAKFNSGRPIKFAAPKGLQPIRISDLAPLLNDMH